MSFSDLLAKRPLPLGISVEKARTLAQPFVDKAIKIAEPYAIQAVGKFKTATQPLLVKLAGVETVQKVRPLRLTVGLLALAIAEREPAATAPASPAKPKSPWLISQKDDAIYMLGSSAVSYLFMALLFFGKVSPKRIWWIYMLFFDAPHVFGTFSRTYADPEEWQRRRKLFLLSLLWFVPGPVAVRLGLGMYFDIFSYMWAYYHLVKQHYGFSVLYKKKNNDLAKIDNYLDKALIWTGFTLPYVQYMFSSHYPANFDRVDKYLPAWTPKLAQLAFGASLLAYLGRQGYKLANGIPVNTPKQILLANSIGMHMVAFRLPWSKLGGGPFNLGALQAVLTVYHNIQYNRLIWFHNQNKYVKGAAKNQEFGLATQISKNLPRYVALAFLGGAAYRYPLSSIAQGKWGVSKETARYVSSATWGFAFIHYYLDSKIWRVRHDARLNKALETGK